VGAQKTIFSQVRDSSWNFSHWKAALVIHQTNSSRQKSKIEPKKNPTEIPECVKKSLSELLKQKVLTFGI
jgi:hypothetical protein